VLIDVEQAAGNLDRVFARLRREQQALAPQA
jgi:hypothetical protein